MLYDPSAISYEQLLRVFIEGHDPFYQPYSRQYQNVVFYADDTQRRAIEREFARLSAGGKKVTTRVEPLRTFAQAEDYHQKHDLRMFGEYEGDLSARLGPQWLFSTPATRINGYLGGSGTCAELQEESKGFGLSERLRRGLQSTVCQDQEGRPGAACPVPARK